MAINRTLTGVNAIIKRNGEAIGFIRSLRLNESITRGSVQGLGNLARQEVPATAITCTVSIDFYNVSFKDSAIPDGIDRKAPDYKSFFENLILKDGIRLDIFKKVEDSVDPATGLKSARPEIFASITQMFIDNDSMNIAEGQVSDRSQNYQYLNPVLYKDEV